jgi:phage terminase small subunit
LLGNVKIQEYIAEIQKDLERLCGISKAKVLNEHKKLAFSSIAHLHETWIERKEFENLTDDQKACISEISTKVEGVFDEETKKVKQVQFVKIKLYDKQKALDSITKLQGYESPTKTELTGKNGSPLITSIQVEIINSASQIKPDDTGS